MSGACRETDLEALLTGELSAREAERVSAHAAACGACARTLAWLRLERGWMAQRARRLPSRPALRFEALETRLRPAPKPRSTRRRGEWRLGLALGSMAAVACAVLTLVMPAPTPSFSEEPWGEGLVSVARVEACTDPSLEAVARVEARVGACLLASPAQPPLYQ